MSRDDNIYYARLAEQGERYEDMIRFMKNVASVSYYLTSFYFLQYELEIKRLILL
mgnify:CR=1 FL=1